MNKQYADSIQSFDFALIVQAAAYADEANASECLNAIPGIGSGPMGLTPDAVRATPEFQTANLRYQKAFSALRAINSVLTSKFKKRYTAHARAKREAKMKGTA